MDADLPHTQKLPRHQAEATGLFFSPDGSTLFIVERHVVAIWDVADRRFRCACPGAFIGFSHDRTLCLTVDRRVGIRAWDIAAAADRSCPELNLLQLDPEQFPYHQRLVISAERNTLYVQDVFDPGGSRAQLHVPERSFAGPIFKTPNDRFVAVTTWHESPISETGGLSCYDIETGASLVATSSNQYYQHYNRLLFSDEHEVLILITSGQPTFYDPHTGRALGRLEWLSSVTAYSAAHEYLAEEPPAERRSDAVRSVSFAPANRSQAVIAAGSAFELVDIGSLFDSTAHMRKHSKREWRSLQRVQEAGDIYEVALHPDGEQVACRLSNEVRIRNLRTNTVVCTLDRQRRTVV